MENSNCAVLLTFKPSSEKRKMKELDKKVHCGEDLDQIEA